MYLFFHSVSVVYYLLSTETDFFGYKSKTFYWISFRVQLCHAKGFCPLHTQQLHMQSTSCCCSWWRGKKSEKIFSLNETLIWRQTTFIVANIGNVNKIDHIIVAIARAVLEFSSQLTWNTVTLENGQICSLLPMKCTLKMTETNQLSRFCSL